MDSFLKNFQFLLRSESLIAEAKLRLVLKQSGAGAFAALIAVFGLGMLNVAGFLALEPEVGGVYAALIVAAVDFILALIAITWAKSLKPGPELDLARSVRDSALHEIETQVGSVESEIRAVRDEVAGVQKAISTFVKNPPDLSAATLLSPLVTMIIKALTKK